jgi:hypothetical protein
MAGSRPASYESQQDPAVTLDGSPSFNLRSIEAVPEGFGTVMQTISPTDYLGRRIRLSGWMRSRDVAGWSGLWMRIDGHAGSTLAFDNMQTRPVKGTTEWTQYEVVLDVAEQAEAIAFGFLLVGEGQVWVDDFSLEQVSTAFASTDLDIGQPRKPLNLEFD